MASLDGRPHSFENLLRAVEAFAIERSIQHLDLWLLRLGDDRKAKLQVLARDQPLNQVTVEQELLCGLFSLVGLQALRAVLKS